MKKVVAICTFSMLLIVLFAGCGSSKAPSKSKIQEDLNEITTDGRPYMEISDCKVLQSKSEKDSYTATIEVHGNGNYAEYEMLADVSYTLYDQGWKLDSSDWSIQDYTIITYPSETEMADLVSQEFEDTTYRQMTCSGNEIYCISESDAYEGFDYVTGKKLTTSVWVYNELIGLWSCDTERTEIEYDCQVSKKLEGFWESYFSDDPSLGISITNVTATGFDVECTTFNTNIVHVEMEEDSDGLTFTGTGGTGQTILGLKENADVKVYIHITNTGGPAPAIQYIIGNNAYDITKSLP